LIDEGPAGPFFISLDQSPSASSRSNTKRWPNRMGFLVILCMPSN